MSNALYADWAGELAGSLASPSEFHGFLTGWLCGGARAGEDRFAQALAEQLEVGPSAVDLARECLPGLNADLADEALTFEPLLPDDSEPLTERVTAMGDWCEGFLAGFALGQGAEAVSLDNESRETLSDIVAISQVDATSAEGEEDEGYNLELIEYLRMAAISLFLSRDEDDTVPAPLH